MTQLNQEQVLKVAKLSRLSITPQEIESYQTNLSKILTLVEQMNECVTDNVQPMFNPLDATQRLRADKVTQSNEQNALLANAPAHEDGLFLVPKVIE